jgi:DNA-binding transcriptional regulator YdaS (Cro superfamily)
MINVNSIHLEELAGILPTYVNQWVAISDASRIIAHGATYEEALAQVSDPESVVMLKVPPVDASLAPTA